LSELRVMKQLPFSKSDSENAYFPNTHFILSITSAG